ncbi:signal peptide peptidase SppA [Sulfuriroseicoccus oceanibius]|uniref:Signal peptide peptidase SppA n=1 Tax=Sulfuriroseicoccus oceanibius TaxID=2707525 RepID=A0A6B3L952_9BACT|nr:signal peptide peptidase SppA [Sulfuriroseicoccus oceanibius]QQL45655.1 signal peptide peptidase SppA [Sulfuriroseicoccus oceanibius]
MSDSYTPPPVPPRRRSNGLMIGCLISLAVVGLLGFFFLAGISNLIRGVTAPVSAIAPIEKQVTVREVELRKGEHGKIAQIDIEGVITSATRGEASMVDQTKALLAHAVADKNVQGIVIRVNSPGGEVTASDVLYNAVKKAAAAKPVVIYMDSVAASGGYYLACGADHIMANPTTLTGSVGVIIQTINYQELTEKIGVDMVVFKSGDFKDMLSGSREMREDEREYVNSLVGESYERFLGIVADARNIPIEKLRGSSAVDGRIYSGTKALEMGMIDATGYIEDAWAEAMQRANLTDATVVRYRTRPNLGALLSMFGSAKAEGSGQKVTLDVSDRLLPRLETGTPYFLHLPSPAGE